MKIAVVISKQDIAGMNIFEELKKIKVVEPIVIDVDSIYSENCDKNIDADFIIFATRHASEKGTPSLSVHAPGNWHSADFGGKPNTVCNTSAQALKHLFQLLNKNSSNLKNYQITLECTHHGPFISKPCAFIEIGSSEKQWKDSEAAAIIAKTIADFQDFDKWKLKNKGIKNAIAVGGPHYAPNHTKIQLSNKSNIAIGHIVPEYSLPLTKEIIQQAILKTQEPVDLVLLDWKGCGKSEQRQEVIKVLEQSGIKYERTEKIEK